MARGLSFLPGGDNNSPPLNRLHEVTHAYEEVINRMNEFVLSKADRENIWFLGPFFFIMFVYEEMTINTPEQQSDSIVETIKNFATFITTNTSETSPY